MRLLLLLLLFVPLINFAQHPDAKRDYQWIFGYKYGTFANGTILNFNYSPMRMDSFPQRTKRYLSYTNSNICNQNGQLAIHTDGCDIYDSDFSIIEGSESLNPSNLYNDLCSSTGMKSHQNAIILSIPDNDSLYYVFYKQIEGYSTLPQFFSYNKFRYAKVKKVGNQKAVLLEKDVDFYKDTMAGQEVSACRHANGRDWWLTTWGWRNNKDSFFIRHLITPDSILGPFKQTIPNTPNNFNAIDQVCFSPDGKKYARFKYKFGAYIYDFDRKTGELSNPIFLPIFFSKSLYNGVAFSSNSKILYISTDTKIIQYDLTATNIEQSADTVMKWDSTFVDGFTTKFLYLYLAPDCKIYMSHGFTIEYMSVVNYPNRKGKACAVAQRGLKLNAINGRAMPNQPNFRLGAEGDNFSPCDSTINPLIVGTQDELLSDDGKNIAVNVYPNPASNSINVDLFGFLYQFNSGYWSLTDISGKEILRYPVFSEHSEYVFDIQNISNGLYFWQFWADGKPMRTGKVVVQK